MAYNEILADRIREALVHLHSSVEEKQMMGGLTFMLNGKMCVGVFKDEMMCRIDPEIMETVLSKTGCRIMDFTGRPMKSYILIEESGMRLQKDFDYWINLCIDFNSRAKASPKKKKKS